MGSDARDGQDVGDEAVVREHDALRLARRPRRVDDGGEVFRADDVEGAAEDFRLGLVDLRAGLLQLEERERALVRVGRVGVEEDDALQRLHGDDAGARVAVDLLARDEEHARARVFEDVAHLIGRLRRVDGDVDRAEAEDGEVDNRPVGAVLGEERHAVTLLHAERRQAQRDGAHALDDRLARDVEPLPLHLQAQRVRLRVPPQRLQAHPRHARRNLRVLCVHKNRKP